MMYLTWNFPGTSRALLHGNDFNQMFNSMSDELGEVKYF